MTMAKQVTALLKSEGVTAYALAKYLKGKVSQRSVYDFLQGKDVNVSTMTAILEACDIKIVLRSEAKPGLKVKWLKARGDPFDAFADIR